MRLPELSYRLAHHFPDALPFFVPFYHKLAKAGFQVDEGKIKPVLRRNGKRIVTDYSKDGSSVTFRFWGEKKHSIVTVDLLSLKDRIGRVQRVADYAAIDQEIDKVVAELAQQTP